MRQNALLPGRAPLRLLDRCVADAGKEAGEPLVLALAYPCDEGSLRAAVELAASGIARPTLVGPKAAINAAARAAGIDLRELAVVDAPDPRASAEAAVARARAGEAHIVMKGALHTDDLMRAIVATATGLRTARRMSHVFILDVPWFGRPLLVTDAAVNVTPTLEHKRDIVRNAVDLAHTLGIPCPCVAILSAVETVSTSMPSTLDAAALCRMAERGQIAGAVLDGPLALDDALDAMAAARKGLASPASGCADILVAPDIEAGNILAKLLLMMPDALVAGIVMGARVPVVLTSRADDGGGRLRSCAIAALIARRAGLRV